MAQVSFEIALRWMALDLTDDKSTLVQVMASPLPMIDPRMRKQFLLYPHPLRAEGYCLLTASRGHDI